MAKQATPEAKSYPKMEFLFQPDQTEPFLRRIEKTCKQLSQIAAAGTEAEKKRAAASLAAFTLAVNLVKELGEIRFRIGEEATSAESRR